jgi:hypothetical protein
MLARIRDFFAPPRTLPPVLVRVRIPGGVAEGPVELVARGRGREVAKTVHASQGVCVVPWLGGDRLDLRVGHAELVGEISLDEDEVAEGEVFEIELG